MAFVPKNYVDNVGPDVSAAWLNGLDVLANSVFAGAQTVPQATAALGALVGGTPGNTFNVTTQNASPCVNIIKNSTAIGGSTSFVASALFVELNSGPNDNNPNWAILGLLNNYSVLSTGAENVAVQGTARQMVTNGCEIWGANFVAIDYNNTANNTGRGGLIGCEIDCYFNGADLATNRTGLSIIAGDGNFNGPQPGTPGLAGYAEYGCLLLSDWGISEPGAQCQFLNGFIVNDLYNLGGAVGAAFQSSANSVYAFRVLGSPGIGLDISGGTPTTAAIRLAQGQKISFDIGSINQLYNNGSGLIYSVSNTTVMQVQNTGQLSLGSTSNLGVGYFSELTLPAAVSSGSMNLYDTLSGTTVDSGLQISNTIAAGIAPGTYYGLHIVNLKLNAGASCGTNTAIMVDDQTTGTTNIGLSLNVTSGTGKFNINATGSAQNFFAGPMSFGTYTATTFAQTGYITITDSGGTTRRLMVG